MTDGPGRVHQGGPDNGVQSGLRNARIASGIYTEIISQGPKSMRMAVYLRTFQYISLHD